MREELSVPPTLERLRRHLVGLRMPRALEMLDHMMRQIERGEVGSLEALEALLAEELTLRESRRIKAALEIVQPAGAACCKSGTFDQGLGKGLTLTTWILASQSARLDP